jgi:DNA-binding protein Fis
MPALAPLALAPEPAAASEPAPPAAPKPEAAPGWSGPTASLEDLVLARLRAYGRSLQGHEAKDLYALIMPQLERPLVRVAMELAEGKQVHAAAMLGIHRNTLRKRLEALGLDADGQPKAR